MQPQSGRTLEANQKQGITQSMEVWHAGNRSQKVQSIKLRWRISYRLAGDTKSEMGEIPEFTLA